MAGWVDPQTVADPGPNLRGIWNKYFRMEHVKLAYKKISEIFLHYKITSFGNWLILNWSEQVLSVTLDGWTDAEIDAMIEVGGNASANSIYEAYIPKGISKPGPDASQEHRSNFIR